MVDFMEDENVLYSQKRKYCAEQGLFYSYLSAKLFLEIINEVVFVKCYEIGNMNSNIMWKDENNEHTSRYWSEIWI